MAERLSTRRRLPGLSVREGFLLHPFDEENGVRTSGLVAGRNLRTGHTHDRHITAYYGVAPSVFQSLLQRWTRSRPTAALHETAFVDIGCGMGRAVLLASEYSYRSVTGVELHPALARIARRNAAKWRQADRARASVRIVQADAVDFRLPAGPCLLFLFNPFGAVVMRRWLRALARSLATQAGHVDILYVNNEQEGVLEEMRSLQDGALQRLFLGKVRRSREDVRADKRILDSQPDGEYASAPFEDCSLWRWRRAN